MGVDESNGEIRMVFDKTNETLKKVGVITDTHLPVEMIGALTNPLVELRSDLDRSVHLGDVVVGSREEPLSVSNAKIRPIVEILKKAVDDVLEGNADPDAVRDQMETLFEQSGVDYHKGRPTLVKYQNIDLVYWPYNENVPDEQYLQKLAQSTDSKGVIILSHEPPFKVRPEESGKSPDWKNIQGAKLLEFCRLLPKETDVFIVSGHTHLSGEELTKVKPYFHFERGIGEIRTLGSANPAPDTRRTIKILPLATESGIITIDEGNISYTEVARPGDVIYRGIKVEPEKIPALRERLMENGVTEAQLKALSQRIRGGGVDTTGLNTWQIRELDELFLKVDMIFETRDQLSRFIAGEYVPNLDDLPPTNAERERFTKAMTRLGRLLNSGVFPYKFVGGSWVETVAKSRGIDYSRRHGDIDVIVSDPHAVEMLKGQGYSLNVGMPDAVGNKEDFSGWDEEVGERVGIFIQPIDEATLLRVSVEGVEMSGQPLEEIYLNKLANAEVFRRKGLVPRKKDLEDVVILESMVDKAKVEERIVAEVLQRVSSAQAKFEGLMDGQGITGLIEGLSNATLPQEVKDKVIEILDTPLERGQQIEQIMSLYRQYARGDVMSKYGLKEVEQKKVSEVK